MGPTLQSNDALAEMHHLLRPTPLGHPVHPWCPLLSWPRCLLTSRSGDSGGQPQTRVTVFFCVCLCCSACFLTHCLPLNKKFPPPPKKQKHVYIRTYVLRTYIRVRAYVPADPYKRGQPAAIDVTVISTLQQLTLAGAASTPGHALTVAEERKMAANSESCHALGINFIPLAVESLGGWSSKAIDTISSIGKLQGQRLGISPSETTHHLFQHLAIALWKGNATLWIRRQPTRPSSVDGII